MSQIDVSQRILSFDFWNLGVSPRKGALSGFRLVSRSLPVLRSLGVGGGEGWRKRPCHS